MVKAAMLLHLDQHDLFLSPQSKGGNGIDLCVQCAHVYYYTVTVLIVLHYGTLRLVFLSQWSVSTEKCVYKTYKGLYILLDVYSF